MIRVKYRFWKDKNGKYKAMSFKNKSELVSWIEKYGEYYDLKRCINSD